MSGTANGKLGRIATAKKLGVKPPAAETPGGKARPPALAPEPLLSDVRGLRADAKRNLAQVLQAAKKVFAASGVDAPVREIADRAGVGIGTLYRHFPRRADLVAAVFKKEIDDCVDAAVAIAAENPPFAALSKWMQRFTDLVATKRALVEVLHSGDPAFENLPARRDQRLMPAYRRLFEAAVANGDVRPDIDAVEFINAVSSLCMSVYDPAPRHAQRMVALLVDGLRQGAGAGRDRSHPKTMP